MNRIFTRNTLFSLLGIFIFSLSFFVSFGHKAEAWTDADTYNIYEAFPKSNLYSGTATLGKNYVTKAVNLSKGQVNSTEASFHVHIDIKESGRAWTEDTVNRITDCVGTCDWFGAWDSVFDPDLLENATTPASKGDKGFVLEIASASNPDQINETVDIPSNINTSGFTEDHKNIARGGTFGYFTGKAIPDINLNSLIIKKEAAPVGATDTIIGNLEYDFEFIAPGLVAGKDYVARVKIKEDYDETSGSNFAYSNLVLFSTPVDASNDNTITLGESVGSAPENASILTGLDCGIGFGTGNFPDCIVQVLYYIVYLPSSAILAGTGYLFNAFASLSISSYMYRDATFVIEGWKTVRDLMNMFFIFALLYAAIRIIISQDSAGSIAPLIKNIIVTAILINFSLFIVRIGIDASNITARIFYNAIGVTVKGGNQDTITDKGTIGVPEVNISQGIVSGFGIQRVTSEAELDAINKSGHNTSVVAILLIFGIIINLVAAGVFFTVGVLFVGRIVGFYMAMLFAPLAFMSEIIPIFKKIPHLDKAGWQSNLLKDIILAPLFLFFIWIILGLANTDFLAKIAKDASDDWIKMLVMIALEAMVILSMLLAAKKLAEGQASFFGGQINAVLSKGLNFVTGTAIGAVAGVGALAGRATIGKAASSFGQSESLKELSTKSTIRGWGARQQLKLYDSTAKSTFDARNTVAGTFAKDKTGFNFNTTPLKTLGFSTDDTKGGYVGDKKRRQDKIIENAKLMEASDGEMARIKARMDEMKPGIEMRAAVIDPDSEFKKFAEKNTSKKFNQISGNQLDGLLERFKTEEKEKFEKAFKKYIEDPLTPEQDSDAGYYAKYNGKTKDQLTRERKDAYAATLEKGTRGFRDALPVIGNTAGAAVGGAFVAGAAGAAIQAVPIAAVAGLDRRIQRDAELGAAGALRGDSKKTGELDGKIADVEKQIEELVNGLKGSNIKDKSGNKLTKLDDNFDITKEFNKHGKDELATREVIDRALDDLAIQKRIYEKKEKEADARATANPTDLDAQTEHGDAIRELRNIGRHIKNLENASKDRSTLQDRLDRLKAQKGGKKDEKKDDKKDDKK